MCGWCCGARVALQMPKPPPGSQEGFLEELASVPRFCNSSPLYVSAGFLRNTFSAPFPRHQVPSLGGLPVEKVKDMMVTGVICRGAHLAHPLQRRILYQGKESVLEASFCLQSQQVLCRWQFAPARH